MKRISIAIAIVLALGLGACEKEERISEDLVFRTLDSLEFKLNWLDYRLAQESWEQYTSGRSDSLRFYQGLFEYVVGDPEILRILLQGKPYISNDIDERRLELIEASVMRGQIEASEDVSELRDSLRDIHLSFVATFDGREIRQDELYRMYRSDANRQRREAAYRAYHQLGTEVADGLSELIARRNEEVRDLGQTDFFALMLAQQGYDVNEFLILLDRLDSLSQEPYRDVLERWQQQLGYNELEIWDLGYANAAANRAVDQYFPADGQMYLAEVLLKGIGYNLNKLPIYFDIEPRENKSQVAYAFPIKPPSDVRVLANLTNGIHGMRTLMHEIGHALHYTHIQQDRELFNNNIAASWTEGMSQLVASLIDEPDFLLKYAGMPQSVVERYQLGRRDQEIVGLRMRLVELQWEYEAYLNPEQDINQLYWDIFGRIMMLPRHDDLYPWASIVHYTTHPVYLHNYLYADIIAAQTIKTLEDMYGRIIDNRQVSAFLNQNYFRFGARYEWRDLLERGTGERFNPNFLISYLDMGATE